MFRVLLYIFLIYLAYQFIFKFVIPLYRTTQQVKKGFREMSGRMNQPDERDFANGQPSSTKPQPKDPNKKSVGEYIDFEEVK